MTVVTLLYILICSLSIIILFYRSNFSKIESQPNYSDYIGVIPIHNEKNNIDTIENAIQCFKKIGIPLALIDNNSTDDLFECISNKKFVYYKSNKKGKYSAIKDILPEVSFKKLILVDADIHFNEKQLIQLIYGSQKNLWTWTSISHFKPHKFWEYFVEQEQNLLQSASVIAFNFKAPVFSNSAFSIINKKTYEQEIPDHLISGGDVLLTSKLGKKQCYIQTLPPVKTNYPSSFINLIKQRKRWLSNNHHMKKNVVSLYLYASWFLLILATPLSISFYLFTGNPFHLIIILSAYLTITAFSITNYTYKTILSSLLYLTFGFIYQLILMILIIFGDYEKN